MKEFTKIPKNCEWTRERTATLISLYQSHECLWNNYIEAYKNKDKRIKAIEAICSQLHISKVDFGKKIHNLRNQFNAEMKKLDKRNESSTEVYRSRWEHYDALKFLRDVIAPRPGYSMTLKGHRKFEIKYSMVDDEEQQQSNEIQETTEPDMQYEDANETDRNPLEFTSIPVVSREEILESKYRRPSTDDIETQEFIQTVQQQRQQSIQVQQPRQPSQELLQIEDPRTVLPASSATIVGVETIPPKKRHRSEKSDDNQRDQWDVFGEFVAAEFRNLNTELSRKKLKRKIMQVMLEVGEEDDGININISLN